MIIDIDHKAIISNYKIILEYKCNWIFSNICQNIGTKNISYNILKKSFITKLFCNRNNVRHLISCLTCFLVIKFWVLAVCNYISSHLYWLKHINQLSAIIAVQSKSYKIGIWALMQWDAVPDQPLTQAETDPSSPRIWKQPNSVQEMRSRKCGSR